MSFTGVDSLDASIDKANAWLADIEAGFGTSDRRPARRRGVSCYWAATRKRSRAASRDRSS